MRRPYNSWKRSLRILRKICHDVFVFEISVIYIYIKYKDFTV